MRLFGILFVCGAVAVYFFNQPLILVAAICFGLFIFLQLFNIAATFMLAAETIMKELPHLSTIKNNKYILEEINNKLSKLEEINNKLSNIEEINEKLQASINKQTDQQKTNQATILVQP